MNNGAAGPGSEARERELVEIYKELTGQSEAIARGVYMHVCCREGEGADLAGAVDASVSPQWDVAAESLESRAESKPWLRAIVPVPAAA